MIPAMRIGLIAPDALFHERSFIRLHNRAAKEALRECALKHHKERIPLHFKVGATEKYGYAPRAEGYKRKKLRRYNEIRDLVSGDRRGPPTKEFTKQPPKIRVGGKATNDDGTAGALRLSIVIKLPFIASSDEYRPGRVSGKQIKREIAVVLPHEAAEISQEFKDNYVRILNEMLSKRPRIRKKYEAAQQGVA